MARRPSTSLTVPRRKRPPRPLAARVALGLVRVVLGFIVLSLLWVLAYRFVPPPITATMAADLIDGRGAKRDWMSLEEMDRDMVRAAIAAEDSKFCSHRGFDFEAMENAMKSNASGGRIRGGSTISQQTAKNAFLWQGGGYARKGLEAWFTLLIERMWGKRRIMEVYLNLAETGIGTYGANAGSQRYFGHDADALSPSEAARLAAVLPLPKKRGAIAPKGFTRRYGQSISARLGIVRRDGLDQCVYAGEAAPAERASPTVGRARVVPGEEYERPREPARDPVAAEPVAPAPAAPEAPGPPPADAQGPVAPAEPTLPPPAEEPAADPGEADPPAGF